MLLPPNTCLLCFQPYFETSRRMISIRLYFDYGSFTYARSQYNSALGWFVLRRFSMPKQLSCFSLFSLFFFFLQFSLLFLFFIFILVLVFDVRVALVWFAFVFWVWVWGSGSRYGLAWFFVCFFLGSWVLGQWDNKNDHNYVRMCG